MKQRELEYVLDAWWTRFGRGQPFLAATLAEAASEMLGKTVTRDVISHRLQSYRTSRRRKYDVSCEGYGRAGLWRIYGVHNHASRRRKEITADHVTYVEEDSLRREARDKAFEALPAMRRNGASVDECRAMVRALKGEVYRRVAQMGVEPENIAPMAESILAPVDEWFSGTFGSNGS